MNDITALIATMKAAAEKATPGRIGDRIDGSGSIKYECRGYDGSLVLRTDHKNMEYGFVGDNSTADEQFFRVCVPDNILALVEALEKAQAINAAAEKLVRCKGRYHSEQNYRALAALFGVTTPDLPPLESESRTVTVKLAEDKPAESESEVDDAEAWFDEGWNARGEADRDALAAAGIQVIEGEQKNG
ncbi:hypothetical protein AB9B48_14780 [Kluyvera ascorbata]